MRLSALRAALTLAAVAVFHAAAVAAPSGAATAALAMAALSASETGAALAPDDSVSRRDSLKSPDAPALNPELSPRERLRRARLADREAIRAERIERRAAIRVSRDSAHRLDNFYFGAGLVRSQILVYSGSDSELTESSAPLGIWFGYRTHFARFLGIRTGGLAHFGSTEVARGEEDPVLFALLENGMTAGSKGMTGEIDASAQAIVGPFGRFAVEPGFYYGFGWHTAKSITLDSDYLSGSRRYEPRPRFSVAGAMLGFSLFFGSRDQLNLTGLLSVGKALGTAKASTSTVGLGFNFAFQDG